MQRKKKIKYSFPADELKIIFRKKKLHPILSLFTNLPNAGK